MKHHNLKAMNHQHFLKIEAKNPHRICYLTHFRPGRTFFWWINFIPFSLMYPSLLCHDAISKFIIAICSPCSNATIVPKHSFFSEIIKVEGTIWPVQRYKVSTFTPFATTRKPFETFQFLSLKETTQPSSLSFLLKLNSYPALEHVSPHVVANNSHSTT